MILADFASTYGVSFSCYKEHLKMEDGHTPNENVSYSPREKLILEYQQKDGVIECNVDSYVGDRWVCS
jgi:hypothetical protein